ncbi:TTC13 protein, partial [Polypterus senegalus]
MTGNVVVLVSSSVRVRESLRVRELHCERRAAAHLHKHNMAPAGPGDVLTLILLVYLYWPAVATEYFSTITFFNSDLHKHGCSSSPDWDEYTADCAIGYVLIGKGEYDEAVKHFTSILQDIKNADLALFELSRVITLEPNYPEVFEQRAEILSPLGRISEALNDLTKAIQLQPSARLYRHRGTLYFISEDYAAAQEDFQQSLELKKNQPIAVLYKGLTFFHRGMLKEAIQTFKEALKMKNDFIDAYKSLGQAYRELGDFESAMDSFQKALILNQNHIQSLQLKGMMLYHHGSLQEALGNFKRCLQLEPYNEVCQYMKGLSHVAMGQFYEGIKSQTKVMLNDPLPGQKATSEYLKVKYLREYSRYLHAHLDIPVTEYNIDVDLPGNFKNHWAKNLPFLIEAYEEQPGLQPHIKDVLPQNFESYNTDVQKLICTADQLGVLMQYDTPGFLPNHRIHRAGSPGGTGNGAIPSLGHERVAALVCVGTTVAELGNSSWLGPVVTARGCPDSYGVLERSTSTTPGSTAGRRIQVHLECFRMQEQHFRHTRKCCWEKIRQHLEHIRGKYKRGRLTSAM